MKYSNKARISAIQLWVKKKLDNDTKELSTIYFDDLPSEEDWISIQFVD